MFPPGFLGTRADVLMDLVMLSFIVILPMLIWSWRLARHKQQYRLHRKVQLALALTLLIVVGIFEYDLSQSGGIFELTKGSTYDGTTLLNTVIYVHTLFAVAASVIWLGLITISLWKFGSRPEPGSFSGAHRAWGKGGMITMMMAGLTSPPLYYLGFVA
jgi:putative membrane protein